MLCMYVCLYRILSLVSIMCVVILLGFRSVCCLVQEGSTESFSGNSQGERRNQLFVSYLLMYVFMYVCVCMYVCVYACVVYTHT